MCIPIHVHERIKRIHFSQASVHEITSINTFSPNMSSGLASKIVICIPFDLTELITSWISLTALSRTYFIHLNLMFSYHISARNIGQHLLLVFMYYQLLRR